MIGKFNFIQSINIFKLNNYLNRHSNKSNINIKLHKYKLNCF